MAHNAKATITNLPNVNDFVGSPLGIIKAKPNLLTELLSPNTGYLQRVKEVYINKKTTNKITDDCYVMDKLTLILGIEHTILTQFKWTDLLYIDQIIEYDNQIAAITELHYVVQTIGKPFITTDSNEHNYLAHITSNNHEIPIIGGSINGKEILNVSLYQIVIETGEYEFSPHFGSISKTLTIDTELTRCDSYTITTSMETPEPSSTIIIDINDDIDKINKICIHKILKQFKNDIIKINDIYIALRPNLHEFLFLCQRIFDDIILFSENEKKNMDGIIKAVHNYLIDKLIKNKKEFNNKKNKYRLWNDVKYRDYCDINNNECIIKNICKFGIDLSRIILIDYNEKYFKRFEPNCIQINKYIMNNDNTNNNDSELMNIIWPILFECSKYNDIRYGLLNKQKMSNTNPISIETDSLAQTMQYLVVLQYSYFKCATNIKKFNGNLKSIEFNDGNNTYDSSVYITDDEYEYEQTDTDNDNDDEINNENKNKYKHKIEPQIEPTFNCSSVISDFGNIFTDMSSFFGKFVSK